MEANKLAECVNLRGKSLRNYGFKAGNQRHFRVEHHLERKFNISVNSMRSEGERDLVFHSEFRASKFDV